MAFFVTEELVRRFERKLVQSPHCPTQLILTAIDSAEKNEDRDLMRAILRRKSQPVAIQLRLLAHNGKLFNELAIRSHLVHLKQLGTATKHRLEGCTVTERVKKITQR